MIGSVSTSQMCSLQQQTIVNLSTAFSVMTHGKLNFSCCPALRVSSLRTCKCFPIISAVASVDLIPPNAVRRKREPNWRGGFSLGVDLGLSRTGLALSKGYSVRPLTVLESRGQKLENRLMEIAEEEEVDEFIIGLPKSIDGKETPQSNKVRSVAGRLAVRAAERGWRVYVLDEHGTSSEAMDRMIVMGLSKSTRKKNNDAYAAVILLERYFSMSGQGSELVLPKRLDLQEKIRKGLSADMDFFPDDSDDFTI